MEYIKTVKIMRKEIYIHIEGGANNGKTKFVNKYTVFSRAKVTQRKQTVARENQTLA